MGTSGTPIPGTTSLGSVHVLAPAKINLYLEVLGKRPDHFHAIETLILAVELFDELAFEPDQSGIVTLTCDNPELSVGPDNLVLKAARLLKEKTGRSDGAAIRLTKKIPWAAGLGGGSSDAAATLAGLNELWKLGLSTPELAAIGSELGSDVPYFFYTPAAWCTGRGEEVTPVAVGRSFSLVLVKPPFGLNTAEVYRELRMAEGSPPPSDRSLPEAVTALAEGDVEKLARCLQNRLQEPAMRLCPPIASLHRRLQDSGAAGSLMTGSGSCMFALCRDDREAERVADDMLGGQPPDDKLARTRVFTIRSCP
ncbi:MAG: 4-(cytidine 5'-diphospho)-2-C-methyl-D-erythritol kinase [Planctomycetes bacterium]|nr:4-(cytidine 5'-diphospho)-2-C-methyl-D-erythritol kinase [Planctomycetota bacterium]